MQFSLAALATTALSAVLSNAAPLQGITHVIPTTFNLSSPLTHLPMKRTANASASTVTLTFRSEDGLSGYSLPVATNGTFAEWDNDIAIASIDPYGSSLSCSFGPQRNAPAFNVSTTANTTYLTPPSAVGMARCFETR